MQGGFRWSLVQHLGKKGCLMMIDFQVPIDVQALTGAQVLVIVVVVIGVALLFCLLAWFLQLKGKY